ncbi:hypothetical protein CIG75_16345 [Tumebacillus algifaecis]|uniref:Uncharacterized protein n=1 Tax=Tumebacillus algifaecis TaxID=1214604 RepID=A0A223D4K3_9BACL|nr:hypothetical protein [Tumebacillus algifaecis]ASS76366.1 hypothetical protein CIG75_16345 [Tumebacillus algifaecis]
MVFEERYGERVTCPHCEAKGATFEEILTVEGSFEEVAWQPSTCARCGTEVLFKRVRDLEQVTSLWLADASGEPLRRYVIFPESNGRRVLWRMFVEDPLHTFLARQGFYDRYLRPVFPIKRAAGGNSPVVKQASVKQ